LSSALYYQTGILYVSGIDENATIAIYDLTGKLVKVTEEAPVSREIFFLVLFCSFLWLKNKRGNA